MSLKEEQEGKFYMGNVKQKSAIYTPENELLKEIEVAKEKEANEKAAEEARNILLEATENKQKEIDEKVERLEMIPLGNKIIISAYPENPYKKIMEGKIIVEFDGAFKNPDSGEWDKQKELVGCAKVIEVGPECKYLQVGDDIYYDTRTTYPVPFMSMGFQLTTEPQILCVLNEGLKDRFKM